MSGAIPPLEYAPPEPRRQRNRRRARRALFALLMLSVAAVGYTLAPDLLSRAKIIYHQHRCMTYGLPPDEVVYENRTPLPTSPTAIPPAPLSGLSNALGPLFNAMPVSFMHERESPNGTRRLVIVSANPFTLFATQSRIPVSSAGKGPPPLVGGGAFPRLFETNQDSDGDGLMDWPHVRVFAGQPDPNDDSHFTIPYEVDGQKDVLDGYLHDDGTLVLSARAGPSTRATSIVRVNTYLHRVIPADPSAAPPPRPPRPSTGLKTPPLPAADAKTPPAPATRAAPGSPE